MRPKQLRLVVTFFSTTAAMAMERYCTEHQLPGRMIPVPREITASCGLAWSAPPDAEEVIRRAAEETGADVEGYYQLMIV